ncbi:hypothetical protein J3S22_02190 [Corynebacterium aurimucosum]|uniref:hypothetical protein n=1 Tax=Corynebacterium aurimucosum TaxID=169292 RepID=UPI0020A031A9|nr:hypothetical protein [Corynebacterium aurimucosum]UTA71924.1 hypothetical protein J3S22_02190 [Corynebacterium aurimucosum]
MGLAVFVVKHHSIRREQDWELVVLPNKFLSTAASSDTFVVSERVIVIDRDGARVDR